MFVSLRPEDLKKGFSNHGDAIRAATSPEQFIYACDQFNNYSRDVILTQSHCFSLEQAEFDGMLDGLKTGVEAMSAMLNTIGGLSQEEKETVNHYIKNAYERGNDLIGSRTRTSRAEKSLCPPIPKRSIGVRLLGLLGLAR